MKVRKKAVKLSPKDWVIIKNGLYSLSEKLDPGDPTLDRIEFLLKYAGSKEPELLKTLKLVQSRLCEHCPQYMDSGEQVGDHTDECLKAMEVIEKEERWEE